MPRRVLRPTGAPILLLDRDGVINRNLPLGIRSREQFSFMPTALDALAMLNRAGATVIVVTNQANLSRGLLEAEELEGIHSSMLATIVQAGGRLDAIYVCPHVAEDGCDCRKPRPGLLRKAAADWNFDIAEAVMIGDHQRDMDAAEAIGCRRILISANAPEVDRRVRPGASLIPQARDLLDAVRIVLSGLPKG
jgi:D-glycero-D-manno-heptose 1,7-bisphosphate phosphatase